MTRKEEFFNHITQGNTFKGDYITLGSAILDEETVKNAYVKVPLKTMNRHGLIAGATGTGKTKTLQVLAENLTEGLKQKGAKVHIETSGAYKLTGSWDWICLSPKKMKLPTKEVYDKANELKVIVYNKDDLRFAEEQAAKVNKDCILYLQPEWSKRDKVIPLIVDYVMDNPKWKVSLQTHKYLNIP